MKKPITDEDIRELGHEAAAAGDTEQETLCRMALAGGERARRECERVIKANRAVTALLAHDGYPESIQKFSPGEEVFMLIRHLREGLEPLVRDGIIDNDRAYERARNTATIVLGTFAVAIRSDLSRFDVEDMLAAEPNPFASPILRGNYGAATELKQLVVNLFNKSLKPDMASIMGRDRQHRELAFAMLSHYAKHGEGCQVFMEIARDLAEELHGFDYEDDSPEVP
jgi:hypothetical protein